MELAAFKQQNNISTMNMYKSNSSSRLVGSTGNIQYTTTENFDPKKPAFAYEASDELGLDIQPGQRLFFITNKERRAPDVTL